MNESNIENRLVSAWRRERLYYGIKGVFNLLLWGTVLLGISFVLDFTLHLPGSQRLALLALNVAILFGILYWNWASSTTLVRFSKCHFY